MWPVRAVSIFSTLMGRRLAWRRGSEGGTACTKGLVLPGGDEPGPGPELFPESALLVQAGSAPPLPPLCLLLLRAESEGAVLMTHPRAWEQRGEARGGLGAARSPGVQEQRQEEEKKPVRRLPAPSAPSRRLEPETNNPGQPAAEPWPGRSGRRDCGSHGRRAGSAWRCAPALRARGPEPALRSALCDVSRCLSSPGSGEETHFKSSCTVGEIKAFAAFQSNGSPR